jgi:hypothetical protein
MINNPSDKDSIYLSNVKKIGESIDNILYIENVLPKEDHDAILNYAKTVQPWNDEPWYAKTIKSHQLPQYISDILESVFTFAYHNSKDLYDVEIDPINKDSLHLVKFVQGFFLSPHTDTSSDESLHIASVYYINDDYTGGEINFPKHNLKIKPKANSLIMFPGNENYTHEVLTIIDKPRYSSALWFQFSGSDFNKKSEWYPGNDKQ